MTAFSSTASAEKPRHFLDLDQFDPGSVRSILDAARAIKSGARGDKPMAGKTLAMIFDKPSTRTRVSFELAAIQLGGHALILSTRDMQLGRGETIADTARVLSRYVDAIMIRTGGHERLLELAAHASVPVVNGLTDFSHPCQILADILTFEEKKGPIRGRKVAYVGDGNNVVHSLIHSAVALDFELRLGCPPSLSPNEEVLAWAEARQARVRLCDRPEEAVAGAEAVITDTWVSMGDRDADERRAALAPFQVDDALMARADAGAIFMHCLPAHRGEEVTAEVMDGPGSVVFDQAENRLHAQKGVLAWCMGAVRG